MTARPASRADGALRACQRGCGACRADSLSKCQGRPRRCKRVARSRRRCGRSGTATAGGAVAGPPSVAWLCKEAELTYASPPPTPSRQLPLCANAAGGPGISAPSTRRSRTPVTANWKTRRCRRVAAAGQVALGAASQRSRTLRPTRTTTTTTTKMMMMMMMTTTTRKTARTTRSMPFTTTLLPPTSRTVAPTPEPWRAQRQAPWTKSRPPWQAPA